ncbi:uncharacterized protein EV422DRAFT_545144 [Fimicolochytrium jonesii]|uniref:uncharacterized protein n=1 Tax=Fimicolochytrium jonesii TaxID=1396493 RepID=UPI0022FEF399|nr:uncharacterized protein EV422DRAFT_545144 [Fimicolochytrium jonesii]KAI8816646.1 hypothetical protein EV422DRAFT_545144 [Fimicolochytrium jonesii]
MRSKGFDIFMIARQAVSLIYLLVEAVIILLTARHEGFRFNLKWGVLIGIFLMTLLTAALHALSLAFRSNSYQHPTHGTPVHISLMCYGFMFGYESLSLMLLKWLTISSSRGDSTPREKNVVQIYRYCIFITMIWFPVITSACVVAIVRAAALNSLELLTLFYKLWSILVVSQSISLFTHALGFLFSGYRLTSTLSEGRNLQVGSKSTSKSFIVTAVREANKASQPKPRRSGLTETVRNLMIAVVFGWFLMGLQLALSGGFGLGSRVGFWSFLYYDVCIAWIAASSYSAMSAGMMETVMETNASSRNQTQPSPFATTGQPSIVARGSTAALRTAELDCEF